MRKSIAKFILEEMVVVGKITFDIFFPYQYSYTRVSRRLFGLDNYPKVSLHTLRTILSRLQREGLVTRSGGRNKSSWTITPKGKRLFKEVEMYKIPPSDGVTRLIIYDIPERERKKRDLLRFHLTACNFKQLQKSVWFGYNPFPKDFIEFLDGLQMKNKIHIFSVREYGTIKKTS